MAAALCKLRFRALGSSPCAGRLPSADRLRGQALPHRYPDPIEPAQTAVPDQAPQAAAPVVRIAILSYNRRDAVRTTLTRVVVDGGYPRDALDPVVVDNASVDGTVAMVRAEFPDVRVIETGANVGASALNRAVPGDGYDWLLILDDDCYLEPGDLERAVRAAEQQDAQLVSFAVRSSEANRARFDKSYVTGMLSFWGCAALVSRAAIQRVGGYDPYIFIWGNELDLTVRLLDEGFRHLYLPDVIAVHMKPVPDPAARPSALSRNLNRRHWGYTVARLLRPADAARIGARLVVAALLDAASRASWRELWCLTHMGRGFVAGARNRRPVRPEVSAAVRNNYLSFASPLGLMRSPEERRRGGTHAPVDCRACFRAARPAFFPPGTATLQL